MNRAIDVIDVWKSFRLYASRHRTLKETLIRSSRGSFTDFWALREINLEINRGECWGIMGVNGAGKSTLFRLLAGILKPTKGSITIREKRTVALLELGVGFHPDFTGLENIYTYGAILGLTRKEIDKNLDAIIEFSGIGAFVEEPLRSYSSGMTARLGFSVAVHVEPDILLIDEVLTVGDRGFQNRCLSKLREFKEQGKTILLVSHSPELLESFCPRSVLIHDHTIAHSGETAEIAELYRQII